RMLCQRVLGTLVEAGFLRVKKDGTYARVTDGADGPRPRPAKADLERAITELPTLSDLRLPVGIFVVISHPHSLYFRPYVQTLRVAWTKPRRIEDGRSGRCALLAPQG